MRAHVHGVERGDDQVAVDVEVAGTRARERYDHVVNALWDGRLAVDATAGLEVPGRPWLYRLKYFLRVNAPALAAAIPSATIVLGAFGDIAAYGGGTFYLSWYPAGMQASSDALSPPAWPLVLDAADSSEMRRSILAGLGAVVPAAGPSARRPYQPARCGRVSSSHGAKPTSTIPPAACTSGTPSVR